MARRVRRRRRDPGFQRRLLRLRMMAGAAAALIARQSLDAAFVIKLGPAAHRAVVEIQHLGELARSSNRRPRAASRSRVASADAQPSRPTTERQGRPGPLEKGSRRKSYANTNRTLTGWQQDFFGVSMSRGIEASN